MGIDGENLDIDGQGVGVADAVVGLARGDIDILAAQAQHGRSPFGRCGGEVEADLRLDGLGFAGGQHVQLQQQVGARIEAPGQAVAAGIGRLALGPTEKVAVGVLGLAKAHAREARLAVAPVFFAGAAGAVDHHRGVVDDAAVAGFEFECPDITGRIDRQRDREIAEDVGAVGGQGIGGGHRRDQIRLAEFPVVGPRLQWRQVGGIALEFATGDPAADRGDLALGQTAFASEATVAGFGFPRRHIAALGDVGDLLGAGDDIAVAEQVEGCRAFGTMAGGAVLQDNGGDIAVEGRRPVRRFAAAGQAACSERDQQRSHCKSEIKQPIARVSLVGGTRSASRASIASARSWRVAVGRTWSKAV